MTKAFIREIFTSIQGEGPYVGERQVFMRFCGCNLNCKYCDTDFEVSKSKEFTPEELLEEICKDTECPTISLTGGEPLLSVEFLSEFLPLAKDFGANIYLETNATLADNLEKVIDFVDIISADIKLESATCEKIPLEVFDKFFEVASQKELFAKIVFNEKITDEEILSAVELAKKHDFPLILQPEMRGDEFGVPVEFCERVFDKFLRCYRYVRLIPQVHKFLAVR